MRTAVAVLLVLVVLAPAGALAKVGGGEITFRVSGAEPVLFSHEAHVSKTGLKCRECHYALYTTVQGHRKATMADMAKGASCGACHNGKQAFALQACVKCHQ